MTRRDARQEWTGEKGVKWGRHLDDFEALLAPPTRRLVELLELDGARRLADIGCGGGGGTRVIRAQAPSACAVSGVDVSTDLIGMASRRLEGLDVTFHVADVATAPAPDGPYDRLASRFGVMFFPDPLAAFSNLARWSQPGARFAFAVWGAPADNPWVRVVREVVGGLIALEKPAPDSTGPFRYADPGPMVAALEGAGFGEVEVETWEDMVPVGSDLLASEAAEFALTAFSNFANLLEEAGPEVRREAHARVTRAYAPYEVEGVVRMSARVHMITGVRVR